MGFSKRGAAGSLTLPTVADFEILPEAPLLEVGDQSHTRQCDRPCSFKGVTSGFIQECGLYHTVNPCVAAG